MNPYIFFVFLTEEMSRIVCGGMFGKMNVDHNY